MKVLGGVYHNGYGTGFHVDLDVQLSAAEVGSIVAAAGAVAFAAGGDAGNPDTGRACARAGVALAVAVTKVLDEIAKTEEPKT